jgi:hypothetical protein
MNQADVDRGNGSAGSPSARELVQQSQRVREDVVALAGTVRQVTHGWQTLLRERLEKRPYATLAVAAGVGYVLGGGLPTGLMRMLAGVGGRLALERALTHFAAELDPRGPNRS